MNNLTLSNQEYLTIMRRDLASFSERAFYELNPGTQFIQGQYIELLAAKLEEVRLGITKRLILTLPPRTLKSHLASVCFPAWMLGHNPSAEIICASYGQDLAEKHARDSRRLMGSGWYRSLFPNTRLSSAKQSIYDFMTTAQGFRMSTSVGGVLTGRGGDLLILDDILKPEDALSDVRRKAANEWFFSTLLSRLNNKENGAIIIVMQRLHQEDLVGEVLDRGPWDVLSLPALAIDDEHYEYTTPFGSRIFCRKAGEAIHPERDSVETYKKIRETVGEYIFQSQYQQSPTTREGGLVKREWLKFYDPEKLPNNESWSLQSWDTACKNSESNDYSVCTTWKLIDYKCYLVDVYRARLTFPELRKAALDLHAKFQPLSLVIEDQASGTSLIQELRTSGIWNLEPYNPPAGSSKYMRLAKESVKFEAGMVYLPTKADWLNEYIREITGFPGTKFDDQVDSTTQALEILAKKAGNFAFCDALTMYSRRLSRGYY